MRTIQTADDNVDVIIVVPEAQGLARYTMFELSMETLVAPAGSGIARVGGISGIAKGVNDVIRNIKGSFYWFIDDDHKFKEDVLLKLMRHRVPVVAAVTMTKSMPFHPILFKESSVDESGHETHTVYNFSDMDGKFGLQPVYACGRPGMLVAREVFDKVPGPWFTLGHFDPEETAEDLYFCKLLRQHGIQIYADFDTYTGHIAPISMSPFRKSDGTMTVEFQWDNNKKLVLGKI